MKKIEGFQIKKIYAIGQTLHMVEAGNKEDDLHLLICGVIGKESIKDLSYQEALKVIGELEKRQGTSAAPPKKKSNRKYGHTPAGMTAGQQKKIWGLMYELKSYDVVRNTFPIGQRLCNIIEKELKINCGLKEPFRWIDYKKGNKLIKIIKKYIVSAKKAKEVVK